MTSNAKSLSLLSKMLHEVDPANPDELRALYDSLLSLVNEPQPQPLTPCTTLAASNLSLEDVVHYFKLANKRTERNGFVKVVIPEFHRLPDNPTHSNCQSMAWLHEGIAKSNALWGEHNETGRRLIVKLLLTDTLWRAFTPSTTDDHPTYSAIQLQLCAFAEISFSHNVPLCGGGGVLITGNCDMCFGFGDDEYKSLWCDTFLGVLEITKTEDFKKGFPQLLAYLGTLHHTHIANNKINAAVFGLMTDGLRYCFVMIDNMSMAYRSETYDLVEHDAQIYEFLIMIIRTAAYNVSDNTQVDDAGLIASNPVME